MSERDQPSPHGSADGVCPIRGAELARDRRDVKLHRLIADAESAGDGFVGKALSYEREDFALAGGEGLDHRIAFILSRIALGLQHGGVDQIRVGACFVSAGANRI